MPGRGFLLNNELTDFSFAPANPAVHDPNLPGPGKRPRSSIAPTIVLDRHDRPVVALGSPGGATIITTVLQTLTGFLDRGLPLADAIAAPRASQRNAAQTDLEPGLYDSELRRSLEALGHSFQREPGDRRGHRRPAAARRQVARGGREGTAGAAARPWWCVRHAERTEGGARSGRPLRAAHSSGAGVSRVRNVRLPSCASTVTRPPSWTRPSRSSRESWLSTSRWMVRRSGRAPYSGW